METIDKTVSVVFPTKLLLITSNFCMKKFDNLILYNNNTTDNRIIFHYISLP